MKARPKTSELGSESCYYTWSANQDKNNSSLGKCAKDSDSINEYTKSFSFTFLANLIWKRSNFFTWTTWTKTGNYRNSDRPFSFSKAKQKRPFRLVSFISYLNTRSVYCLKIYLNQVNSKTSFLRISVKTSFSCPFFWRPGHVESFPDLEMNSAQVDFGRPRCWILALSWNELSLGSFLGTS